MSSIKQDYSYGNNRHAYYSAHRARRHSGEHHHRSGGRGRKGGKRHNHRRNHIRPQINNIANQHSQSLRAGNGHQRRNHVSSDFGTIGNQDNSENNILNQQISALLDELGGSITMNNASGGNSGASSAPDLLDALSALSLSGLSDFNPQISNEADLASLFDNQDIGGNAGLADSYNNSIMDDINTIFQMLAGMAAEMDNNIGINGGEDNGSGNENVADAGASQPDTSQVLFPPDDAGNNVGSDQAPSFSDSSSGAVNGAISGAINTDIQPLLDGLDTSQLGDLLQMFSADDLAQMLRNEGTEVSSNDVEQLLSQLGLEADVAVTPNDSEVVTVNPVMPVDTAQGTENSASISEPTQVPVQPGIDTLDTSPSTNNANTDAASDIQSLLGGIDSNQLNSVLQTFSLDELAQMLSSEGTAVSADELARLLGQLGFDSSPVSSAATPTTPAASTPEQSSGAQDSGQGQQTPQNSGDVMVVEVPQSPVESAASAVNPNAVNEGGSSDSNNMVGSAIPVNMPVTPTPAVDASSPAEPADIDMASAEAQLQSLLTDNSDLLSSVFDFFTPEELSSALAQEGTDISATDLTSLLAGVGIRS